MVFDGRLQLRWDFGATETKLTVAETITFDNCASQFICTFFTHASHFGAETTSRERADEAGAK